MEDWKQDQVTVAQNRNMYMKYTIKYRYKVADKREEFNKRFQVTALPWVAAFTNFMYNINNITKIIRI